MKHGVYIRLSYFFLAVYILIIPILIWLLPMMVTFRVPAGIPAEAITWAFFIVPALGLVCNIIGNVRQEKGMRWYLYLIIVFLASFVMGIVTFIRFMADAQ